MTDTSSPLDAFISPYGKETCGSRLLRRMLAVGEENLLNGAARPSYPENTVIRERDWIPEHPESPDEIVAFLQEIFACSRNLSSPRYIAHMDSCCAPGASLGAAFASAVLKNNMLSFELGPALHSVELQLVRTLAREFGLGPQAGGGFLAGGSLSNLQALAVARNVMFNSKISGITQSPRRPVLFASEVAHSSLNKAAMVLGLGSEGVEAVRVNRDSQMDVEDLEQRIAHALLSGKQPFCVVATAGTTVTGNIDPLEKIARVAQRERLWFHVDAIHAGAIILSRKQRFRLHGAELADSVCLNFHKWLYAAQVSSLVLFRNFDNVLTHFRIGAPYMSRSEQTNLGEFSLQGSRDPYALGIALAFLQLGRSGYEHLIEAAYLWTEHFTSLVHERDFLELASAPETNIVCFRFAPGWVERQHWDRLNEQLQAFLLAKGGFTVSLPSYRGSRFLRVVLEHVHLNEALLDEFFACVDAFAKQVPIS